MMELRYIKKREVRMIAVRRVNDLTGTGKGNKCIFEEPFKDDFHTRLRSCVRGLIAMANAGEDDNSSQFFFTLGYTLELQNKHTIFCKVTGETIYNMLELEEALVDELVSGLIDDTSLVTDSIILCNEKFCYRDFNLLSFVEEAVEDEEESVILNKKFIDQGISSRDHLTDSELSS
ncbi:Peptidyl-prolyl cis-trans isomerase CWC27 like protein [Eufriesea mexicana]|uniref:Peptidyl-prolyl cis-trans isomerase n=1 Tax=Eufriesea mexicana TaxID=516756 RepID=A0A310SDX4_9HYME|nr:Peptidyl-prolyl cis-trans isomerase CWC27 like protein [Eufriesea mexicana]